MSPELAGPLRGAGHRRHGRRSAMWYVLGFILGAVLGSVATFWRVETRCRECGGRENCEQFP
jgi:hypothetical protein